MFHFLVDAFACSVLSKFGSNMHMTTKTSCTPLQQKQWKTIKTLDDFKCCPLRLLKKLYMMVRKQNLELPDKAGFHVRRCISHRPELIEEIPEQNQVAKKKLKQDGVPNNKGARGVMDSPIGQVLIAVFSPAR